MKKSIRSVIFISSIAVASASIPFLIGSAPAEVEKVMKQEGSYSVTPPDVPKQVTFAGEAIDLTPYDRRERMDRELSSFTYMHSTTMLMIKRANRYFPIVEPILKANGIPDDFKYLMVIESNLSTLARSPVGAAGLWQFMDTTGRSHGLEVNKNVDERYNIRKATKAACKYLKEGYAQYGDWITVAASYNAGKGRISTELNKQEVDSALDLWLNQETSRYMFRILAAKEVFNNPKHFGFLLKKESLYPPIPYKEVKVNTRIADLAQFAKQNGITYAQLKDANPWLRDRFLENRSGKTYTLLIPTKEGMNYDPSKTVPYNKNWVIN